jgi:DNA-directed RNA polymerase subunit RPC12/RpoP
MKKILTGLIITGLLLTLTASLAYAQATNQLQLGLRRDFGYGLGGDIQGLFTVSVKNPPANLAKVDFLLDTTLLGEVTKAPFSLQFNTDSYPLGNHSLSAKGFTTDGTEISSNVIQVNFVPSSMASGAILRIVLPIVGLLGLMVIVALALPILQNKGKLSNLPLGVQRNYGIGGGAICPKCGRPFPLRLWFINLGMSKIDRCPYCGKWSLLRPRPLDELRSAEQAELAQAQPIVATSHETEAEKLKKELDDSRFQDM